MTDQALAVSSKTSISVTLPPANGSYDDTGSFGGHLQRDYTNDDVMHAPPHNTPVVGVSKSSPLRKTPVTVTDTDVRVGAARVIERAWLSYRDRQMFHLLKHSVCAAEHSLSYEIMRKVAPKEAEFFKDPGCNLKVRFRFGGGEFPPEIFFKIFVDSDSAQIKYITGKKLLTSDTQAAREACDLMGARKFYDIMLQDVVHHQHHKITDEIDITTSKDYMQYLSILDETPAYLGGKENYWRRLTLDSLPRTTIFYDLMEFAYSRPGQMTPRLRRELPALMARPVTQEIQRQHIHIISQIRSPIVFNDGSVPPAKSRLHADLVDSARTTGRRSKQAQRRMAKMRKIYQDEGKISVASHRREVTFMTEDADRELEQMRHDGADMDGPWDDEEAQQLYQWSQQLPSVDDVRTPRLSTMMSGIS